MNLRWQCLLASLGSPGTGETKKGENTSRPFGDFGSHQRSIARKRGIKSKIGRKRVADEWNIDLEER